MRTSQWEYDTALLDRGCELCIKIDTGPSSELACLDLREFYPLVLVKEDDVHAMTPNAQRQRHRLGGRYTLKLGSDV